MSEDFSIIIESVVIRIRKEWVGSVSIHLFAVEQVVVVRVVVIQVGSTLELLEVGQAVDIRIEGGVTGVVAVQAVGIFIVVGDAVLIQIGWKETKLEGVELCLSTVYIGEGVSDVESRTGSDEAEGLIAISIGNKSSNNGVAGEIGVGGIVERAVTEICNGCNRVDVECVVDAIGKTEFPGSVADSCSTTPTGVVDDNLNFILTSGSESGKINLSA